MPMNMKEDNLFEQVTFNSKHPEAPQANNERGTENLHTKIQCQNQQLQHVYLEKERNTLSAIGKNFNSFDTVRVKKLKTFS